MNGITVNVALPAREHCTWIFARKAGLKLILVTLIVFSASGCATFNPEYPSELPALNKSVDIESELEGSYSCYGKVIRGDKNQKKDNIAFFFFRDRSCERIDIRKSENGMIITLQYPDFSTPKRQEREFIKNRDYNVDQEWLVLDPESTWKFGGLVDSRTKIERSISVNELGQLVIKGVARVQELVAFIPAGSRSMATWGTFERLAE